MTVVRSFVWGVVIAALAAAPAAASAAAAATDTAARTDPAAGTGAVAGVAGVALAPEIIDVPPVPRIGQIDPSKLPLATKGAAEATRRLIPNQFPEPFELPTGQPPVFPAPPGNVIHVIDGSAGATGELNATGATGATDATGATGASPDAFPLIDARFDGPFQDGIAPTDAVMAVGRGHVVTLVNVAIQFNTKAGALAGGPYSARDFFGIPSGWGDFDPLAIYDPFADRFIVAIAADNGTAQDSRLYVAFSQTGDPTQGWNKYFIDADLNQSANWLDYPSNGIDRFAVYYTGNMFRRAGGFNNVTLFIYNKEDGYAGLPLRGKHVRNVLTASGGSAFRLRPAFTPEIAQNDEQWFAQMDGGFGSVINLIRLTGDRFDTPQLTAFAVPTSGTYFGPGTARQPGGAPGVATLGGSAWNAWYRNRTLWVTNAISGSLGSAAWVHKIDLATNPPTRVTTYQVEASNRDVYFPHVVPDVEDDDFALVSAFSGPNQYVTGRYWNIDGTTGAINTAELTATGTLRNSSERHGDYFAVGTDPLDRNRIWGVAQYHRINTFSGNAGVASVRFEDVPVPVAPSPVPQTSVRAARAGSNVNVTWNASACSAPNHHIVWFDLAQIARYEAVAETCAVGAGGSWSGAPPAGNVAFIVVGNDGTTAESSHGAGSDGRERPSQARQCGIQQKIWSVTCGTP